MWTSVLVIISTLVGYFFKPKTTEQQDIQTGMQAGVTTQKEADENEELQNVQKSSQAVGGVKPDDGNGVLNDSANAGPAVTGG